MTNAASRIVTDAGSGDVRHPQLEGRRFSLVPFTPEFYLAAYHLTIANNISYRWRFHGSIPSYEQFINTLHANVLIQFVVVLRPDPKRLAGMVVAYNGNLQDGYAYLGAISDRSFGAGIIEGLFLLMRYVFTVWPVQKLYFETPSFNVVQFESAIRSGLMVEESRLKNHTYYDGRNWDYLTYAMYREQYEAFVSGHSGMFLDDPVDKQ